MSTSTITTSALDIARSIKVLTALGGEGLATRIGARRIGSCHLGLEIFTGEKTSHIDHIMIQVSDADLCTVTLLLPTKPGHRPSIAACVPNISLAALPSFLADHTGLAF